MIPWRRRHKVGQAEGQQPASVTDYLRRVDLFKDLAPQEIEALFLGVMLRECTPRTILFTPEDASERIFILKTGLVEIYRLTADGKRLITRRSGPGTIFGEMGILGQSMQHSYAEAIEDTLVCVATREDVLRLLAARPDITVRLLEAIGNRLKVLEDRLEQAVFSPVRVRLASFLVANADPATGELKGYTQADIGDTIGALRQTVTEALSEMERDGLLEVGHKRIRVRNLVRLKAIAEESGF